MSFLGILWWIAQRLDELASNPGGTTLALALWVAAAAGFALGHRRILAATFALVPLSAFVLAALRLLPWPIGSRSGLCPHSTLDW